MTFSVRINGKDHVYVTITEDIFTITDSRNSDKDIIDLSDIIGIQDKGDYFNTSAIAIHVIRRPGNYLWTTETLELEASGEICKEIKEKLTTRLRSMKERPRSLLVLISPVAGGHKGERDFKEIVKPLFDLAGIETEVMESKNHIKEFMTTYDYDKVNGFVVFGGDGSLNQCINPLIERTQKQADIDIHDPSAELKPCLKPVASIPSGTGNAVAQYCYGCRDIKTVALHIIKGRTRKMALSGVYSEGRFLRFFTLLFGFGLTLDYFHFTEYFRWLGRLRYIVVAMFYYLLKPYRVYRARVYISPRNEKDLSDISNPVKYLDATDEVKGEFISLVSWYYNFRNPDYNMGSELWKSSDANLTITSTDYTSKFHILFSFLRLFVPVLRSKSESPPSYVKTFDINCFRVKPNAGTESNEKICVDTDGEPLYLNKLDVETRHKGLLLTVFSSLEDKTKKPS